MILDLLSLTQTVRRHKLATIPAIMLAVAGIGYVVVVKAPIYQATSSYILMPGTTAPPPTPAQIARDPALKHENPNNPFAAYGDLSVVGALLTQMMSSPSAAAVLASQGVSGSFTVAPDTTTYGNPPILDITAEGPTAAVASNTAALVGKTMQNRLAAIQAAQGTSRQYWIGSLELAPPTHPHIQLSSKLRDLVAVIVAGMILLFVIVSILNARDESKRQALPAEQGGAQSGRSLNAAEPKPGDRSGPVPRWIDAQVTDWRRWHHPRHRDQATASTQQPSASALPDQEIRSSP